MLDLTQSTHHLQLRWKSRRQLQEEGAEIPQTIYEQEKPATQSLKDFITTESRKGASICLEYWIDGISVEDWINEHYFERAVLGEEYANNISFGWQVETFASKDLQYRKNDLKLILGQLPTVEDYVSSARHYYTGATPAVLLEKAKGIQEEETQDTMLYCSSCCGDRYCGYFGIQVYQTEQQVVWFFQLGETPYRLPFLKIYYFKAFGEYTEMLNKELTGQGIAPVDIEEEGRYLVPIETQVEQLQVAYGIEAETLTLSVLESILELGKIEEMNAAIYWAQQLKMDLTPLENFVEAQYKQLSEEEKSALSWKILDNSAYFGTLDLCHPELIKKAFLLFG